MLVHLEKENFKDLISKDMVLVDFYAEWCGPCKMLGPVLEKLGSEGYNIVKVDVDNFNDLAREYGVMSVPSLFIFKNGNIVKNMVGFMPYEVLKEELDSKK